MYCDYCKKGKEAREKKCAGKENVHEAMLRRDTAKSTHSATWTCHFFDRGHRSHTQIDHQIKLSHNFDLNFFSIFFGFSRFFLAQPSKGNIRLNLQKLTPLHHAR